MSTEEAKVCRACGRFLTEKNKSGVCSVCQRQSGAAYIRGKEAAGSAAIIREFKYVARALRLDPDDVLVDFCTRWMEQLRLTARCKVDGEPNPSTPPVRRKRVEDDDDDSPSLGSRSILDES